MLQRTIGMYVANKIKDEILRPPQEAEEVDDSGQSVQYDDPLDGETIFDDDGRALGQAYRMDVAVYVVGPRNANANGELERAVSDEATELIVHREGRQITALVYVPEQTAQTAAQTRGFRADDV